MKSWLKIVIEIIGIIIVLVVIDITCIFTIKRPLFAIQNDGGNVYRGIFYDTYNCAEYSTPQIKRKGLKLACSTVKFNTQKVVNIIDKTKNIEDFACAEALEQFYEDATYQYYWECLKNDYMVVEYESGFEETISKALEYKTITIDDLDDYNIQYIKYENKS